MADFKKWTAYLYAYSGEVKGNNVGFARIEVREGRCRLAIGVKGAYGCDVKGLQVGVYIRRDGKPYRIPIGMMQIRGGCGEYERETDATDLFGKKITWEDWRGLWLISPERDTIYLASWEKSGLDAREFLSGSEVPVTACEQLSLWDSLCRCYPKILPQWQRQGVEFLRICPADLRYLPRSVWFYGNNSFLLHGYYQHKHLVLGRIAEEENSYLLGIPGRREPRECYLAEMFGFHHFLPIREQEGYWYTKIHL